MRKLQSEREPAGRQAWCMMRCEMKRALSVCALRSSAASSTDALERVSTAGVPDAMGTPSAQPLTGANGRDGVGDFGSSVVPDGFSICCPLDLAPDPDPDAPSRPWGIEGALTILGDTPWRLLVLRFGRRIADAVLSDDVMRCRLARTFGDMVRGKR